MALWASYRTDDKNPVPLMLTSTPVLYLAVWIYVFIFTDVFIVEYSMYRFYL